MKQRKNLLVAMLLLFCTVLSTLPVMAANAPVISTSTIFANKMVLQRNANVAVFGFCDTDGTTVTVTIGDQTKTTISADGKWSVKLDPMEAAKNLTMTIAATGGNTITLSDVGVGEVWLCAGQSNMQFELTTAEDYASVYQATLGTKDIRAFSMSRTGGAIEPCTTADKQGTNNGAWRASGDTNFTSNISAIGYMAAYEMAQQLGDDVPIGLLNLCNGDTSIEVWMAKEVLESRDIYSERVTAYNEGKKFVNGETTNADGKYFSELDGNGKYQYWKQVPSSFYNRMIAPFQPYTFKGCFWYQGCSNASRADQYLQAFDDLTTSWRAGFENPNMPFITVQLAPYAASGHRDIREAQFTAAETLDNVYLVSSANEGYSYTEGDKATNSIHPWRKSPVAKRAAHTALNCIYNNTGMGTEYSHPIPTTFESVGNTAILHFEHTGTGLVVDKTTFRTLNGFEVSADGTTWVDAQAIIGQDKTSVTLQAENVSGINYIRYGYNQTGSGAVIERTDGGYENATSNQNVRDDVLRTTLGANLTNSTGYPTPAFKLDSTHKNGVSVEFYGKNAVQLPTNNKVTAGADTISVGGTYYQKKGTRTATLDYEDNNAGSSIGKNNYTGEPEKTAADWIADFATQAGVTDSNRHGKVAFLNWGKTKYDVWSFYGYDLRGKRADVTGDVLVFSTDLYFEAMYNCSFGTNRFITGGASAWETVVDIGFTSDNKIYAGAGTAKVERDFSLNTWHNLTILYNYGTQKYSVALDGDVFAVDLADKMGGGKTDGIGCFMLIPATGTDMTTTQSIYFDNVAAYRYKTVTQAALEAGDGKASQTMNGDFDTFTARVRAASNFKGSNVRVLGALYVDDAFNQLVVSDNTLTAGGSTDLKFQNLDSKKTYQLELFFWDMNTLCPVQASALTEK